MTNGEKIKAMFPSMEVGFITDLQVGIYFVKNQHNAIVFSLDWWNAEYQEPSSLEKPNKSEIPTGSDDCISRQDVLSEIIRFSTEEGASVECQQLYCDVNNMPSVTPIKPKGHWQKIELPSRDAHECSECCGLALLDENNEQLTDFCPSCGADMREVEEWQR